MNMQTRDQSGYEDRDKDKRFGYCKFDIDPFSVDLTGSMKIAVYRKATPDVPDTVMACDEDWYVKVEWDLQGRLLHHLCGYFCVCVYLERIGPGPDLKLDCDGDGRPCIEWIPIDPCGDGHYEVKCDRPKDDIECEACGTLYLVAVTLTSLDQCKDPGHIRAYCKEPTLMFYPPHNKEEQPAP
jgi:hypothetical protein